jgi:thymidylate kinase
MTPEDAALISRMPVARRGLNGIPEPELAAARERAAGVATEALTGLVPLAEAGLSPLGSGWSRDLDFYMESWPDTAALERLGWLSLDGLLGRLGSPGVGRWAVVDGGEVLACVDLHLGTSPDPVSALLERCRRRGEVRVREVLEFRALLRSGSTLPTGDEVVATAARVEAGLGGRDLARWALGPPLPAPAPLPSGSARRAAARWRPAALASRITVAVSGVDGSGKTTVCRLLARDLVRLGIPVTTVWTRPGMRLSRLKGLARMGKRLLRQDPAPGVEHVAAGRGAALPSRRGAVGWVWALLVTLSFLSDARRQHRLARGVVLYDRHLLDAVVTLDFVYGGVDLRVHRALIRRLLPRATMAVYLDLPASVAVERKQDDLFGERAVNVQLDRYSARRSEISSLRVMDATRPPEALALEILERLVGL